MNPSRALALAALITGIAVLAISQMFVRMQMRSVEPLNGAYGNEAMIAFELARTPSELARVIGADPPSDDAKAIRRAFDEANHLDFWYMGFYAAFLAFSFALLARVRARKWLLIGVLLGPIAALCDVAENLVLLQLTQNGADIATVLPQLQLRTMAKWELLAILAAMFASAFIGGRRWVAAIAVVFIILNLGSGAMTLVAPAQFGAILLWSIAAVWFWQIGYAATMTFRKSHG